MSIQLNDNFVNDAAQELFQNGLNRIGEIRNITLRYYPETEVQRITTAIRARYESAMQHIGLSSTDTFRSIVRNSIVHLQQPSTPSQPQGVIQAIANTASNIIVPQTSSQSSSSTTAQSSVTPSIPEGTLPVRTTFVPLAPRTGSLDMPPSILGIIGAFTADNFNEVKNFINTVSDTDARRTTFYNMMCPSDHTARTNETSPIIVNYLLREANFDENNMNAAFMHNPFLRSLFSSDDAVARAEINEFMDRTFPVALRALRSLDCSNCATLTDAQLRAISRACPNLKNINVSGCRAISNAGARAIATHCRQLQHVNVSNTCITNDGVRDLASCPLHSLDVGFCRIDNDVLRDLVQSRPQLQSLNLQVCSNITDTGFAHLGNLTQLQSLNLLGCRNISDAGLAHLRNLAQLQSLDLSDCYWITAAGLAHIGTLILLQSLNLCGCGNITDAGLAHLGNLIKLQNLNLRWCRNISNAGARAIATHCRQLQHVNVRGTCITNDGVRDLASCPLQSIDVSYCVIIDNDVLRDLVQSRPQLQSLDLAVCRRIDDAGLAHLSILAQLQSLNLQGCPNITDAGLAHLCTLAQLQSLNLQRCPNITDAGLAPFIARGVIIVR